MEQKIIFRGRHITEVDIETIKSLISTHPTGGRRFISQEICRIWNWRQQNGHLKVLDTSLGACFPLG